MKTSNWEHEVLKSLDEMSKNVFNIEKIAFKQQFDFINDKNRLKALFCTRRAAKSYTGGIYLISEAIRNPNSNGLFIGLTRQSAHGIIWKDILKELDIKHNLNIKFNEVFLSATLPNGSVIWVTGADTDEQEMNKLLGKKYGLVIIDEASMFSIDMERLVYGVLKPATADQRGTICLLGTASNITRGLFHDITTGKEPGWSLHQWTAYDNPHVKAQWDEEIKDIEKNRPLFKKTALFKQWYENKWVIDENALVYKFSDRNNSNDSPSFDTPYHYVLGVHIGHSPEPSAFVIAAYHDQSPFLYFLKANIYQDIDIMTIATKINDLDKQYKFDAKIAFGSTKMAITEINTRHNANIIQAEKKEKDHWINLINSDFIQGMIKILPDCYGLKEEMESLVWISDNGKVVLPRKEHGSLPNYFCNAMLCSWRHTHAYLNINYRKKVEDDWETKHIRKLEEQVKSEQDPYGTSEFDDEEYSNDFQM